MKKTFLCFFTLILFFSLVPTEVFAASTSSSSSTTSYDDINFPQWAKDLRRTEIITFGSLPFVTLWTTVGYSLAVYGKFKNPLDKSTSSFTENDQWNIIAISSAACVGLGLTDLAINLFLRSQKNRKSGRNKNPQAYSVMPASEFHKNELPPMEEGESEEQALEKLKRENESPEGPKSPNSEIFNCGVQSVLL